MFWKNDSPLCRSTSFRLTLWYALIYSIASVIVYVVAFWTIKSDLTRRVDLEIVEDVEEMEELYNKGLEEVKEEIEEEMEEEPEEIEREFFRFLSRNLTPILTTDITHWEGIDELTPSLLKGLADDAVIREVKLPNQQFHSRIVCKRMPDGNVLQGGFTFEDEEKLLNNFTRIFSVIIFVMTLIGCTIGWFIARKAMAGVMRVTNSAVSIASGDLQHRVDVGNEGTEIENLAQTFNNMIERIQSLIDEIREVSNNIAHDLRSPITRIHLVAERTLTADNGIESYRQMAATVIEECRQLIEMIKIMLQMAEMDAGAARFNVEKLNMVELIEEAVDLFQPVAEQKNIAMEINAQRDAIFVNGDKAMLQRVIANLLDNALKYTPKAGHVSIEIRDSSKQVVISVIDSGIVIASEDLPHIFKPFYRADKSRSTPGSGLGLSLARSIVTAHSGQIVANTQSGKGNEFTVLIPQVS